MLGVHILLLRLDSCLLLLVVLLQLERRLLLLLVSSRVWYLWYLCLHRLLLRGLCLHRLLLQGVSAGGIWLRAGLSLHARAFVWQQCWRQQPASAR